MSDELPKLSLETIRLTSPDVADEIETVNSNIAIMIEELDKDSPDYDAVNTAQRAAYDMLSKMVEE